MLQVAIGGADHARFRARIFLGANAAEFSVLQHLQKFRLQAQAEFANFIEKTNVPPSARAMRPGLRYMLL